MTFLLCDPGWYVHKPDVQNKWEDNTHTHASIGARSPLPTPSFLSLMSTCGEVGSDVHALMKELAIRRAQHRSNTHSNESQHLAEGTEVARLRRRFSFVLQQALSFRTRHHLCRQGEALASTRLLRSQGPASVQAQYRGGNRIRGTGRSETGSGGGLESGAGTETVPGSGVGTRTERERERKRGWR